jgi:CheY-like chemotaxis protein
MTKTALIVDDSRLACRVMAKMLETFDFQCSEAYSAESALESLQQFQPDIIFLDHNMPGMHGLEMMKHIKSKPLTANIPVMMHTAKEGDLYVNQALALGAAEVLPKGLDKVRLSKALSKLGLIENLESVQSASVAPQASLTPESHGKPEQPALADASASSWLNIWQQQVQPFLQRQNDHNQQQLANSNLQQTRQLTREMHITLEQFEHALVLRMESHADFVAATEKLTRSARRKWLTVLGVVLIGLQSLIIWQLWQNQTENQQMVRHQQNLLDNLQQQDNKLNQLEKSIASIEANTQYLDQQLTTEQDAPVSLLTKQGEFIADLLPVAGLTNTYHGITLRGYQFYVDSETTIGKPMPTRYYLDDNCQSDAFIKYKDPMVYRETNGNLWFITHKSTELNVTIRAKQEAETCTSLQAQPMQVFQLHNNDAFETGVDPRLNFELQFYR